MESIATNSINLGRAEHRLIPCGFPEASQDFQHESVKRSTICDMQTSPANQDRIQAHAAALPLQFIYLHQTDAGMMSRYRMWIEWLSEGRTRPVSGELIAASESSAQEALACTLVQGWQFLIYEPSGHPRSASVEVQP